MLTKGEFKSILLTRYYQCVAIESKKNSEFTGFFEEHQKFCEEFALLIPSTGGGNINYKQILKNFVEQPDKTTIVITEEILYTLIKEEHLENFFKFLFNKKKHIILFINTDQQTFFSKVNIKNFTLKTMTNVEFQTRHNMFAKFKTIKIIAQKSIDPFFQLS